MLKGQYHVKLPDPYDFAAMLVDINTFIKPRLYVMDGITAMEGNGPRSGKPKQLNVLLLSADRLRSMRPLAGSSISIRKLCRLQVGREGKPGHISSGKY
jgi:hypothetical protein